MKKLLILLTLPLMAFQCDIDEPIQPTTDCNCFNEIVYINDGTDTILIEKVPADKIKCELWGLGDEYQYIPNSEFVSRYKCE